MIEVSPAQRAAVNYLSHSTIVAVPGSGKSRCLIAKAVTMLSAGYKDILIVSFTNASAKELKERLDTHVAPEKRKYVSVGTFHRILLDHLKSTASIGLMSPQKETTVQLSALRKCGLSARHLSEFQQVLVSNQEIECENLNAAKKLYIDDVLADSKVTITNVVEMSVKWMKQQKIPPLKCQFIFVDEFQDVCIQQLELVIMHGLSGIGITVSGDDDQSIYGFRDACGVGAFLGLENVLGAKRFILNENYRSNLEVISVATKIISQNKKRIDKKIESHKGKGGAVTYKHYVDAFDEANAVANKIAKTANKKIFVLARNNRYLERVADALQARGVSYTNVTSSLKFDSVTALIAIDGLIALESQSKIRFYQLLLTLIEDEEVAKKLTSASSNQNMFASISQKYTIIFKALVQCQRLLKMGKLEDGMTVYFNVVKPSLDLLGYSQIGQLTALESYLKNTSGDTVAYRCSTLSLQRKEKESENIQLSSIHHSKGLEAEVVYLIGISEKIIPSDKALQEVKATDAAGKQQLIDLIEEERRLLYVGATRAETELHISSCQGTASQKNRYGPSVLLSESVLDEISNISDLQNE